MSDRGPEVTKCMLDRDKPTNSLILLPHTKQELPLESLEKRSGGSYYTISRGGIHEGGNLFRQFIASLLLSEFFSRLTCVVPSPVSPPPYLSCLRQRPWSSQSTLGGGREGDASGEKIALLLSPPNRKRASLAGKRRHRSAQGSIKGRQREERTQEWPGKERGSTEEERNGDVREEGKRN